MCGTHRRIRQNGQDYVRILVPQFTLPSGFSGANRQKPRPYCNQVSGVVGPRARLGDRSPANGDLRSPMALRVPRLVLLLTQGAALLLGAAACQSSNSAKAKEASRQQEARKRLLQKKREAIAKREQRQQELED